MAELLTSNTIKIYAWQDNRIQALTVSGENKGRKLIFALYGEDREIIALPSSNTSVTMTIKNLHPQPVQLAGRVTDATKGQVEFTFKNGELDRAGDFPFFITVTYQNSLKFSGMSLRVLDGDATGYTQAVVRSDAFTVLQSDVAELTDRLNEIIAEGSVDNSEVTDARGGYPLLRYRLAAMDENTGAVDGRSLSILTQDGTNLFVKADSVTGILNADGSIDTSSSDYQSFFVSGYIDVSSASELRFLAGSTATSSTAAAFFNTRGGTAVKYIDFSGKQQDFVINSESYPLVRLEFPAAISKDTLKILPSYLDGRKIKDGTLPIAKVSGLPGALDNKSDKGHTHSGYATVNPAGVLDGAVSVQSASIKNAVNTVAIQSGAVSTEKLADGSVTTNKIGAGAVTPALLSETAKALFAQLEYAGAAKFLPDDITVSSGSIKGSVNAAAIQARAITTGKLADGAVTEGKLDAGFMQEYGHLPFADIADYGDSADIPYDNYTIGGIYRFAGRYIPITLFVIVGNESYITQTRIQGDNIQSRAYTANKWTEWDGGKAELAQIEEQIAQLQLDTGSNREQLDGLDEQYAGTVTVSTTTSFQLSTEQIAPGSEVILTLTNGPITSCFIRSDYYPLYYYKTNQVVQPEYNSPIPVSAEDLVAGVKLNYGGAFTVKYQTAPSKVFFDYSKHTTETAKQEIRQEYEPYIKNQIIEYADGSSPEISDGVAGTAFRSVIVQGKTTVTDGIANGVSPTQIKTVCSGKEITYSLQTGVTLYGTPGGQFYDTFDAVAGVKTTNCSNFPLLSGWIYGYTVESTSVTWITDALFLGNKKYYLCKDGAVSDTNSTDWQGKIQLVVPKADAGITSSDTGAQARTKMLAYWGNTYAILPAKTPVTEQYAPVTMTVPDGTFTISADYGEISAGYCKDTDKAYLDIIAVQLDLEGRIAQLEINSGGGNAVG